VKPAKAGCMSHRISRWKRAPIAAVILTTLAVAVVFGINPGGFEVQGSWFLVLLPAVLVAYPLLDYIYKVAPHAEPTAFWVLLIGFNFLWYWGLSYVVIRSWRLLED
jgi:hypothetical protein